MATVQHVYSSDGHPDFAAEPGAHCIDSAGRHYLCTGEFEWLPVGNLVYMTTHSEPPPAPSMPAICTATTGVDGVYRTWITANPGGESWIWQELAIVPPAE